MSLAAVAVGVAAVGGIYAASTAADAQNNATNAQVGIAGQQSQLGQDQLAFDQRVYDEGKPARDFALQNAQGVSQQQLQGMQFAYDQAKDLQQYNVGTYRPLEQQVVSQAQGYDTPARRMQAAAAAEGEVDNSFDATRQANDRDLARMGIAPGSGKAMALQADAAVQQGAARAGAGTTAIRNVEQQGFAREMDAASLGRNLPSNQATQQSIGATTGTASVGSAGAGVAAQQAGVPNMNAGYSGAGMSLYDASRGFGSAAGGYGSQAAAISQGFGSLGRAVGGMSGTPAGTWMTNLFSGPQAGYAPGNDVLSGADAGSWYSDKKMKRGTGKPANKDKALAEINATPVEEGWSYKPGSRGDDGGQKHVGPMAQTVRRTMGPKVAPGGKVISGPDMGGKLLAGMQALTQRVGALERRAA